MARWGGIGPLVKLAGRVGRAPWIVIAKAKKAKMAKVRLFLKFILQRGDGG